MEYLCNVVFASFSVAFAFVIYAYYVRAQASSTDRLYSRRLHISFQQVIDETHAAWKGFMNGKTDGGKLWKA